MDRRLQRLLFLIFGAGIVLWLYRIQISSRLSTTSLGDLDVSVLEAANATLGFGAVVAVSRAGSPRREGLLLAANITEIDITIPEQPKWTDEDVQNFRAKEGSVINRGSALAWLGHLNALRWFLATDLETVLILEDDVDWDIHLRTSQIPATAAAIRQLVTDPTTLSSPPSSSYWGASSPWDILYLGHCGDIFPPTSLTPSIPHLKIPDPHLPARPSLHPYTLAFLNDLQIPDHTRLIHQSIFPLCTFAFALTRPAAHRLLEEIAPREAEGGTLAYDVRVLEACRDLGFRCWSSNPEIFHHLEMASEIADVNNNGGEGEGEKAGADADGRLKAVRVGSAPNIGCGVRGMGFGAGEGRDLEFLRELVGRQGKCLEGTIGGDGGMGPE